MKWKTSIQVRYFTRFFAIPCRPTTSRGRKVGTTGGRHDCKQTMYLLGNYFAKRSNPKEFSITTKYFYHSTESQPRVSIFVISKRSTVKTFSLAIG